MNNEISDEISATIYHGGDNKLLAKGLMVLEAGRPLNNLFRCREQEIVAIVLACMQLGIDTHSVLFSTAIQLSDAPADEVRTVFWEGLGSDPERHLWKRSDEDSWTPILARRPVWPFTSTSGDNASGTLAN